MRRSSLGDERLEVLQEEEETQTRVSLPPLPATQVQAIVSGRKWDQGTAPRLFSLIAPCLSPGLQGLKGLMALPQVTQLLHAFVSLVRMRLGLLRVGLGVRVEWSHGRWGSPIWKTCAKTTAPPCAHAHSIFHSEMPFPSPSVAQVAEESAFEQSQPILPSFYFQPFSSLAS